VVAIGEHRSRASEDAVHGPREPRTDRLHPASECILVVGFHDQMRVIPLERVMHEPKILAIAPDGKAALDLSNQSDGAQRSDPRSRFERYVTRRSTVESDSRPVSDPRTRSGLPSGSRSSPTVSHPIELELFRTATH
jgi:hypothetical protein